MNYKNSLPSSKNHSKNAFPLLKLNFHYRIFVNARAILDSILDCNTNLLLYITLVIL